MILEKYRPDLQDEWDDFVDNHSSNGILFHKMKFLSYHGDKFEDTSLLIRDDKKIIIAVFPSIISSNTIISHQGSSYGGLVLKRNLKLKEIDDILTLIIDYYKTKLKADSTKIILQEKFEPAKNDVLEFLLFQKGFQITSKEISTAIYTIDFFNYSGMRKSTRQYIKSGKINNIGVEYFIAEEKEDIVEAYNIISSNLKKKYNKTPTHSLEEILELKNRFMDDIKFFCAREGDVIIGVYVIFALDKNVLHTFYISSKEDSQNVKDIGIVNSIMLYAKEKNYKYLNFGISSRGKEIKWWIHNYKEQYSKHFFTRDTWECEL